MAWPQPQANRDPLLWRLGHLRQLRPHANDDTRGGSAPDVPRMPHGHDPLPRPQVPGASYLDGGQARGVHHQRPRSRSLSLARSLAGRVAPFGSVTRKEPREATWVLVTISPCDRHGGRPPGRVVRPQPSSPCRCSTGALLCSRQPHIDANAILGMLADGHAHLLDLTAPHQSYRYGGVDTLGT